MSESDRSFQDIMKRYRLQPQAESHVCCLFLTSLPYFQYLLFAQSLVFDETSKVIRLALNERSALVQVLFDAALPIAG